MCNIVDISEVLLLAIALGVYIRSEIERAKERRTTVINEFTKRYSDVVYNIPEKIVIEDLSLSVLNEAEKYNLIREMRRYFDLCFDEYTMHKNGLVEEKMWKIWSGGIAHAMKRKPFQDSWQIIKKDTAFGEAFDSFMDSLDSSNN